MSVEFITLHADGGLMLRVWLLSVAAFALTGCSTTPADLESKAAPVVQNFAENYQEIYRRTATTAKRCISGNVGAYASLAVDSELYSELGYGELTISLINVGVRNYYLTAKIERVSQTSSRITIRSGNSLAADANTNNVLRWANGDPECMGFGPPPSGGQPVAEAEIIPATPPPTIAPASTKQVTSQKKRAPAKQGAAPPPPQTTIAVTPTVPELQLSESDRVMNSRN